MKELLIWIPALPFIGFLLNGIFGRRIPKKLVHWIACLTTGVSFLLAGIVFFRFIGQPATEFSFQYFTWIQSGAFRAEFGLLLDPLSMVMALVVCGVGFLIHIYSIGYMWHEGGYYRFFAYMNLFMASMLMLVLADNFLLMFVGWEGVGLCSYLLIGFYFEKKSASDAGKKAFIVNRIGDFGFVLGILLIFLNFNALGFPEVFAQVAELPVEAGYGLLTAIGLLLFVGATGKSAQIPLYVWLPDAMEGPTPVSALIHAATMVTAGVYMVTRTYPIYTRAPEALFWVALVGSVTALFAATIGIFQRDIKRVLAYSTVSQLGYMFTALGVMAFSAGIFHLMTHAFFKALLFLGSGSVILALHHEQDMQNMGGLRKYLPVTCWTMWFGTLAIAGVPLFSGFFSKDDILWQAFAAPVPHHLIFYILGTVAALITAFYMFRLMILTFHGRTRYPADKLDHVHESPRTMTTVLSVLALLSLVGGYVGLPAWLGPNVFKHFLDPVFKYLPSEQQAAAAHHHSINQELMVTGIAIAVALLGIIVAWVLYQRRHVTPENESSLGWLHRLIYNKYYVDEIYDATVIHPIQRTSESFLWKVFDVGIIDGIVNGYATLSRALGIFTAQLQNGLLRSYLGWVVVGSLFFVIFILFFWSA
ncbi:MAG: NADH-quinone oxidoreductase subunit L [Acidobacteria bacterium]|nr:NADH-quinone oxidoreductase subunit L [Acidobacteriota bacterium]